MAKALCILYGDPVSAKTQPVDPREAIGVKSNAAEQHERDFSRKAEARAFAGYWQRPI